MDDTSEFAAVAIADHQLVPWPRIAAVAAMVAFSIPTFETGLTVFAGLTPGGTLLALLLGSLIVFAIGAVMGSIGARTHLSSYLLVRIAFGDKGAGIVNIAFAISLIGWFGVNINFFMDAADQLASNVLGFELPGWIWAIIASTVMTLTTFLGFKAINILATAMVPILVIVTIVFLYSALQAQSLGEYFEIAKPATSTLGDGISSVVGAIIIGAIILPDITRFARHWSGAVYTAFIGYIVVQLFVMGAAVLAGGATGQTGILEVMLDLGLGVGAFIIVIAGSWALNALNLYSAVLSTKATFPKLSTIALTIGFGVVGVAAALMNILGSFEVFLWYLSIIFVPVAGVIMVDYLFTRRESYLLETLSSNRSINWKAFAAWAVGAIVAVLMDRGTLPSLTGTAAMDAAILSGLLYTLLAWSERGGSGAVVTER